jgi:N-acetylglucosamine-6-phosphate deacetylase
MTRLGVRAALVGTEWVAGDVAVDNGTVTEVGLSPAIGNMVAVPGYLDTQVNGFAGVDVRTASVPELLKLADALRSHGVVGFCPTLHSAPLATYCAALATLEEARAAQTHGAVIMGAHLEGPFLSSEWAGDHDPAHLLAPDTELMTDLLDCGQVGLVTLAPELPGAMRLIRDLHSRGVPVSIGHTGCDAETARLAFGAGAQLITHIFNAHTPFAARSPGPAAVALSTPEVRVCLIADGHHVAPESIMLAFRVAGVRVRLVSDLLPCAGTNATTASDELGDLFLESGVAKRADGTIAGSLTPLDECVRVCVDAGIDERMALSAASGGPDLGFFYGVNVIDDGYRVIQTMVPRHSL